MADSLFSSSFRLGPVFAGTARILLRNAGPLLAINVLPSLPTFVILAATGRAPEGDEPLALLLAVVGPLLSLFAAAATADGACRSLRGGPFLTREGLGRVSRRYLPLLGAAILSWLLIMAGLAALVVPGLMAIAALFVVLPVCIIESRGSVESMERAARLTNGHRWRVFALCLSTAVPMLAVSALLGDFTSQTSISVVQSIGDEAVSLLYLAVTGVTLGVSYEALRAFDEGGETGTLVMAFE